MVQHLIVPVDGSPESWTGFDVACALAARCDTDIRVVHVAFAPSERGAALDVIQREIDRRTSFDVPVTLEVRIAHDTVAGELDQVLDLHPGAIIVMASHGKGRSAAIVGSVTEDMLQRSFGPLLLVGPHTRPDDFSGLVLVTVDGSEESEFALPLAAAWATDLRTSPWIVNVARPANPPAISQPPADTLETAYTARLARQLESVSGHAVGFDELHGKHAANAVAEYATTHAASLIVASSHGRSGLSRLAMGSVVSGIVRRATCPVLVVRLPHAERARTTPAAASVQA
ncbi:MAG: universal stress protein [Ilumatobacter sp.]|uniref:universal stress protein n=1 Tax=Ilumatobacter sp. TaxID=1967498 RepID=UPI003C78AB62